MNSINPTTTPPLEVVIILYKRTIKKKFNNLRKKSKTYTGYLVYEGKRLRESTKNNRFKDLNYIGLILIELDFI